MVTLITYDISDNTTRTRIHKFLKEFGLPTQLSVFECDLDQPGLAKVRRFLMETIDPATDSVRIYKICDPCLRRVMLSGLGIKVTRLDYMVIG
jgi:CRISPR-associated protein Cas2